MENCAFHTVAANIKLKKKKNEIGPMKSNNLSELHSVQQKEYSCTHIILIVIYVRQMDGLI